MYLVSPSSAYEILPKPASITCLAIKLGWVVSDVPGD
jgi:hypothetical protein